MQGFWPDGLYTAPSDAALAADIEIARSLNLTTLRKHIKVEPDRWYYHADRCTGALPPPPRGALESVPGAPGSITLLVAGTQRLVQASCYSSGSDSELSCACRLGMLVWQDMVRCPFFQCLPMWLGQRRSWLSSMAYSACCQ